MPVASDIPSGPECPVWAKVSRATDLFPIDERDLKALIRSGEVRGYKRKGENGAYIVDCRSLDQWFGTQADEQQAAIITRSIKYFYF